MTIIFPVSVTVNSSLRIGPVVYSPNSANVGLANSPASSHQVQGANSLASSSTLKSPYEVHQRLFGYSKRKSKTNPAASKKSKKDIPWTHTFVCVPETDTDHVPTDYALMTANGLGKAKLHLSESSSAMDIHTAILQQFPKLSNCGGYELLRTVDNTKRLSVITPPADGYTGQFLKKVLGQANCYIRPLQHDIELEECPAAIAGVEVSHIFI